jgi:hypothetical protein
VHTQTADGEMPSIYDEQCEYIKYCHGQPIRGGPLTMGLGEGLTTSLQYKTLACHVKAHKSFDLKGQISRKEQQRNQQSIRQI